MITVRGPRAPLALALVIGSLGLAACGDSDDEGTASAGANASGGADVAAADAVLRPYTGRPSAFPVDAPLERRPDRLKLSYLQCVTPVCGLFGELLGPATKALGAELQIARAGASSEQLQSAMDTIIADDPAAVILPAVEPASINTKLSELDEQEIPTSANGIMGHERFGIDAAMLNRDTAEIAGRLLAAWVVKTEGDDARPVMYTTPELSFGPVLERAFMAEMKRLCSDCATRQVDVPVATIGNAAPSRVVSDLQANPDTNLAVFSTSEASVGLPAALRNAGLAERVQVTGFAPNPAVLQDMKAGRIASGVGLDVGTMIWTQVDQAARLALGQDLTEGERAGIPPMQMLESSDLEGVDVSNGWSGYPDFPERFARLWRGAGA